MNFKQTVQISMVALGFVSPAISPHMLAGETGFETGPAVVTTTTEVSREAIPDGGTDVGISSRDGITFSAPDVLLTSNGVTERVTKSITLPNGTRVMPNGTVILASGAKVWLRPEQILTLGGVLQNAPIVEAVIENPDPTIDVRRMAAVEVVTSGSRARPAARRLSTRPVVQKTIQTMIPTPLGVPTQILIPMPTSQYTEPEAQYPFGE